MYTREVGVWGRGVNVVLARRNIAASLQLGPISNISRAQRLVNLEIPVLVRSLKSGNVELE